MTHTLCPPLFSVLKLVYKYAYLGGQKKYLIYTAFLTVFKTCFVVRAV